MLGGADDFQHVRKEMSINTNSYNCTHLMRLERTYDEIDNMMNLNVTATQFLAHRHKQFESINHFRTISAVWPNVDFFNSTKESDEKRNLNFQIH